MNKHLAALAVLLAAAMPVAAQFAPTAQNARQGALGGCFVPERPTATTVETGYRRGYMMHGMATRSLQASMPLGAHAMTAVRYTHFGDTDYHEQQLGIGAAIVATKWLTVAAGARYSHIGTTDGHYHAQQRLDAGAAMLAAIGTAADIWIAAGSRRWSTTRPVEARIGLAYRPSAAWTSVFELTSDDRTRLRYGMEYTHNSHIAVRTGMATNPLILTFGMGYADRHYGIDLATEVHPVLGVTPQLTLRLCL